LLGLILQTQIVFQAPFVVIMAIPVMYLPSVYPIKTVVSFFQSPQCRLQHRP
jgi:hypothetical protein